MIVAAIIPALDEETAIGALLEAIDRTRVRDVIVGDNGSRDRTAAIAASHRALVVPVDERGYGAACAGALAELAADVDTILFMDADGSDDPAAPIWSSDRERWASSNREHSLPSSDLATGSLRA